MSATLKAVVCAAAALTLTAVSSWTLAEGVYTADRARATVTIELDADLDADRVAPAEAVHLAQAG